MATYLIININILDKNDRGAYDEYIARVRPVVENHGGEYIVRSEQVAPFAGTWRPDRVIVIRFDNRKQLDECFASPEYLAVKTLRESSVETTAFIVEQQDAIL